MTQEEKAKAYDESLKKAKALYGSSEPMSGCSVILETILPELAESEDKKVRKELIKHLKEGAEGYEPAGGSSDYKRWLAWLEKQGEKKLVDNVKPKFKVGDKIQYLKGCGTIMTIEKIENGEYIFANNMGHTTIENGNKCHLVEQKPADKVESKFKVGDWLVHNERKKVIKVVNCTPLDYEVVNILGYHHTITDTAIEKNYHLWTIKDAMDGDVLVHNSIIFIFMGIKNGIVKGICSELSDTILNFDEPEYDNDYCPATNEQRDLLFQKMREAGYTFDFEKKELKKIESQPKQEWSEEDEKIRKELIGILSKYKYFYSKEIAWLKSLRPQSHWKPSEEQMMALLYHCSNGSVLSSLYNDLKKLKEV